MKKEKIDQNDISASSDQTQGSQTNVKPADITDISPEIPSSEIQPFPIRRIRVGLTMIGFVQITVFLIGLAIIALGSYHTLMSFWPKTKKSLLADFGSRVVSTGYVICVFTSLADVFGFGSHPLPNVFFGPLQAIGVMIGMGLIALGFLMLVRFDRHKVQ
jgi:hypothetical protein